MALPALQCPLAKPFGFAMDSDIAQHGPEMVDCSMNIALRVRFLLYDDAHDQAAPIALLETRWHGAMLAAGEALGAP